MWGFGGKALVEALVFSPLGVKGLVLCLYKPLCGVTFFYACCSSDDAWFSVARNLGPLEGFTVGVTVFLESFC